LRKVCTPSATAWRPSWRTHPCQYFKRRYVMRT
jgi:hypothetical protein